MKKVFELKMNVRTNFYSSPLTEKHIMGLKILFWSFFTTIYMIIVKQ